MPFVSYCIYNSLQVVEDENVQNIILSNKIWQFYIFFGGKELCLKRRTAAKAWDTIL